jgi:hypothetical protein
LAITIGEQSVNGINPNLIGSLTGGFGFVVKEENKTTHITNIREVKSVLLCFLVCIIFLFLKIAINYFLFKKLGLIFTITYAHCGERFAFATFFTCADAKELVAFIKE